MKISNKKGYYEYTILKEYIAGIKLVGSEVKSMRNGDANLQDSYCFISNDEIFLRGLYVSKNKMSSYNNHEEKRDRKLLLHKREIRNIVNEVKTNNSVTLIALEIFEKNGRFKAKIGIARGKKLYDKRETIKARDIERRMRTEV